MAFHFFRHWIADVKNEYINPTRPGYKKKLWPGSIKAEASGLSPKNSHSIPPKSSSTLPMKSFFNSLYSITKPPKKLKVLPMLLIWRWICVYLAKPENTDENQPITTLKPRAFANTTVTSKELSFHQKIAFSSNLCDVSGMI